MSFLFWNIHRMQIWRTTRSAPGTSLMKARLVGLWCFVLTMFPQRRLASSSIWSVLFRCGYELLCFWTPRERILIFHRSPLRENSGSMQFVEKKERSSRSPRELWKLLQSGWKILENAKATAFSSKSSSFGSKHSLDTTMGAVEVQSLGYYTVVDMCFVRFRASGREVNFFFWNRGYFSRGSFLYFGEGTGHVKRVGTPPDTT